MARADDKRTDPALSPAASEVLQGQHTPNLYAAQLHFDFDFCDGSNWIEEGTGYTAFMFNEDEEEIREMEEEWQWRALMAETWRALSSNQHVKALTVKDFKFKMTSSFGTDDFRHFLARLEYTNLSILGFHDPHHNVNVGGATMGFGWFFHERMGDVFFRHMHALRHLEFHASVHGPLGCGGQWHPNYYQRLPLEPEHFPALQSLTLSNCFIGTELLAFLRSHARVLKSLDVGRCSCIASDIVAAGQMDWDDFFDEVYKLRPVLSKLVVGNPDMLLDTLDKGFLSEENHIRKSNSGLPPEGVEFLINNLPEETKERLAEGSRRLAADVRRWLPLLEAGIQKLKEPPTRIWGPRIFTYGYLLVQEDNATFCVDVNRSIEAFHSDNRANQAYDRLMELVRHNAS